jgi:hypothetical protein
MRDHFSQSVSALVGEGHMPRTISGKILSILGTRQDLVPGDTVFELVREIDRKQFLDAPAIFEVLKLQQNERYVAEIHVLQNTCFCSFDVELYDVAFWQIPWVNYRNRKGFLGRQSFEGTAHATSESGLPISGVSTIERLAGILAWIHRLIVANDIMYISNVAEQRFESLRIGFVRMNDTMRPAHVGPNGEGTDIRAYVQNGKPFSKVSGFVLTTKDRRRSARHLIWKFQSNGNSRKQKPSIVHGGGARVPATQRAWAACPMFACASSLREVGLRDMVPFWKIRMRLDVIKERILHKLMPSRMNIFPCSWPLVPDACPCDVHFCEYLKERGVAKRSLFHFGSGGHHLVGLRNRDDSLENEVWAITASVGEHAQYLRQLTRDRSLAGQYRLILADIYDLDGVFLPQFDVVTLFHLCEYTPTSGHPRRMDDAAVLDLFCSKLRPHGSLFFYEGSCGFPKTNRLIERRVAERRLSFEERYKSLVVYRV